MTFAVGEDATAKAENIIDVGIEDSTNEDGMTDFMDPDLVKYIEKVAAINTFVLCLKT